MRINIKLIRASQFFYQFIFNVKHKSGKKYILFDILSRLINLNINLLSSNHSELNALYEYNNFNIFFTIALI